MGLAGNIIAATIIGLIIVAVLVYICGTVAMEIVDRVQKEKELELLEKEDAEKFVSVSSAEFESFLSHAIEENRITSFCIQNDSGKRIKIIDGGQEEFDMEAMTRWADELINK